MSVPSVGSGGAAGGNAGTGQGGENAGGGSGGGGVAGLGNTAGNFSAGTGGAAPAMTPCEGLLLCDDFEAYAADAPPTGQWSTHADGQGSALVDASRAFTGSKSVHFHGRVGPDAAYMVAQDAPVFPVEGDALFVRFMMYIERYSNGDPMHTRLVWVGSTRALNGIDGEGYAMETYNGIAIERIASSRFRDTSQRMTDAANAGQWLCWEFEINNNDGPPPGANGTVLPRLWREGVPMNLAVAGSVEEWNPVPWEILQFSLFAYQTDEENADFWIDDVAMNTTRIGCPEPTENAN